MQKKWVMGGLVFILSLLPSVWAAAAQSGGEPAPRAVFVESSWSFEAVLEGEEVVHDFVVRNEGAAPLEILGVKTA